MKWWYISKSSDFKVNTKWFVCNLTWRSVIVDGIMIVGGSKMFWITSSYFLVMDYKPGGDPATGHQTQGDRSQYWVKCYPLIRMFLLITLNLLSFELIKCLHFLQIRKRSCFQLRYRLVVNDVNIFLLIFTLLIKNLIKKYFQYLVNLVVERYRLGCIPLVAGPAICW